MSLITLAERMAKKALKINKPIKLERMSAYERKIIHTSLQSLEGITTKSEGEEPNRHLIIIPVKKEDESGKKKVIALSVSIVCVLLFIIIFVGVNLFNGNWTNKKIEVDNFVGLNYEQQILNNVSYSDKFKFEVTLVEPGVNVDLVAFKLVAHPILE